MRTLPLGRLPDIDGEPQRLWESAYTALAARMTPENSLDPTLTARILHGARHGGIAFDRHRGAKPCHEFVYFYEGPDMTDDGTDLGLEVGKRYCCSCGRAEGGVT